MHKPTIGIAVDSFLPRWDGVSRSLIEFIPRMVQRFNFRLIVPKYSGERPHFAGVDYALFPMVPGIRVEGAGIPIARASAMKRALEGVDLLWTHSIGSLGGKALKVAKEKSIPVISMIHSIEWEIYAQNLPLAKTMFKNFWLKECRQRYAAATRILTPSQATAETLKENGFQPPITITPLGVDTKRFQPIDEAERASRRRDLAIKDGHLVIGYLGRFGAEKNLELLIDAFTQLNSGSTHLLMVGGNKDAIKRKVQHPRVTFIGSTTEPEYFYQVMDAYVLPSLSESAPLAILEAMATGAIPFSTPVGNVPSYLSPNVGYLFEQQSVASLVARLQEHLSHPQRHPTMRENARKLVVETFDWNESARRIEQVFQETLSASN